MSITTETKVGLLVLAALGGLGWLAVQSGTMGTSYVKEQDVRVLKTEFSDAAGISAGSKVRMAGVDVGEVTEVTLAPNGRALLTMGLQKDLKLPANVHAQIATVGLIGEKYIALMTDFAPTAGLLPPSATNIPTAGSTSVEGIAGNFAKAGDDLQSVTSSLRQALGGPDNAEKLTRIVNNVDSIGARLEDILNNEVKPGKVENIVDNVDSFTTKLNKDSGTMVSDLRDSAKALKAILADNQSSASDMIKNFSTTAANLADITDRIAQGKGMLGQMLTKDSHAMENFELAVKDIREVAQKINHGDGTIGKLINDPSTAEKIDTALDSFSDMAGRVEAFRTDVDFYGYSLMAESGISKGRLDITLRPRPTRYYVIGVMGDGFATKANDGRFTSTNPYFHQEFGKATKFTFQFGQMFEDVAFGQDLGFRIGIKDSSFGLGADTYFADNLVQLSADLYDFSGLHNGSGEDQPHLDLTAKVNLIDKTLYAVGGYDNALSSKYGSPFVGLGLRFRDDDLKYMLGKAL